GTSGYQKLLRRLTDWKPAVVVVFFVGLAATYFVYQRVPTSFVPGEDQGYLLSVVQAPPGTSIEYTTSVMDRASASIKQNKDVLGVFSIPGFTQSGSAPNQGIMFIVLKPVSARKAKGHSGEDVLNDVR